MSALARIATCAAALATATGCAEWRAWLAGAEPSAASDVTAGDADPIPAQGERTPEAVVGVESVAAGFSDDANARFAASPIPVIAPAGLDADARAGMATSFRALEDGYFTTIPGDAFDVIIEGTKSVAVAPAAAGAPPRNVREPLYSEQDEGASVTFSRFGVDYVVSFACHAAPGCVDEAQARAYADALAPVGGSAP